MRVDPSGGPDHLSRISTFWAVVREAHGATADRAALAQARLLERYGGAVQRYLLGALRDRDAAEELYQEFALRVIRGDFRRAAPERGRFRDFLKASLFHLIIDYYRRKRRDRAVPLDAGAPEPAAACSGSAEADRAFLEGWRDGLLARTWERLADAQRKGGPPFYTVLRLRAENPAMRSTELAEHLGARAGRALTAEATRQILHRARERFADLLLVEVARTLNSPTRDDLEQELIDVDLLELCRSALERRYRPR